MIGAWWQSHRPSTRRLAQVYSALLYNAHLKGFAEGKLYTGNVKALCVPGLNCYSCPGAVGACPLGSLQNALAASGHTAGWYVLGILLLFGISLGRTVCGWLCPMGLLQELLHAFPTPKIRKNRITGILSYIKYVILAVLVIAVPLYFGLVRNMPMPAFCKFLCPAGTLEGAVGLLANPANEGMLAQLGLLFTGKWVILVLIGLACVFCYRSFCRFLCPLGAIYGLFNRFALTGVRVDPVRCNHCGACVHCCPMDIRHVNDRECIACGRCMGSCAQNAISLRCGSFVLAGPGEKGSREMTEGPGAEEPGGSGKRRKAVLLRCVLAAVLAAALIWFNRPEDAASAGQNAPEAMETATGEIVAEGMSAEDAASAGQSAPGTAESAEGEIVAVETAVEDAPAAGQSDAPVGHETGQQLEEFTCTLTDGTEFRLADTRGKVVFINQWATYCTPCVAELPAFEQLQEEHPEIVVLAFHHWLESTPKAVPYIEEMGWADWQVRFTVDTKDDSILDRIGGDNTMPRTVVLNPRGEVIYNEQRSVTYEMLCTLLEMAEEQ